MYGYRNSNSYNIHNSRNGTSEVLLRNAYLERAARERAKRARKVNTIVSMIAAVLVLLVLVVSLLMFSITSRADTSGAVEYKYYTSELVTADHTVNDIAGEYLDGTHYRTTEDYIRELCLINHLQEAEDGSVYVAPGNYLIAPYYSYELK